MVRLSFYLVLFLTLFGCKGNSEPTDASTNSLKDSTFFNVILKKWPSGTFVYQSEKGVYSENWSKTQHNEIRGKGFFVIGVDTLFNMRMRLVDENGQIKMYYLVNQQNGGKETEFTLTHNEGDRFVFENPFRSFPSVMSYEIKGDTAMRIIERGFKQNREWVEDFVVKKK